MPTTRDVLASWIKRCEELRLPVVSGAAIRQKAMKIRAELLLDPQVSDHVVARLEAFGFSTGWLARFQARFRLNSRRVHGEASTANQALVEKGRKRLREATARYAKLDLFNMDESAYYYCAVPSKTTSSASFAGRKKVKKRITVAITSNADGSSRPPLHFVGSARQPRCFGSKTPYDLGLQYTNSAKGWDTSRIFSEWIDKFNDSMREQGRKVLLLLDNVSPHQTNKELLNTDVLMLPPNTTAHLQPKDVGVIQAFKSKIIELKNKRAVFIV